MLGHPSSPTRSEGDTLRVARVDQVMDDLEDEFGDSETLRADVEALFLRYEAVHVQDFVPIFVERELRAAWGHPHTR